MVRQRQTTTKSDLRNALSKLLLQQPFESITIRQLTETAGINRGTFYLHYVDKYDMFEQMKMDMMQELDSLFVEGSPVKVNFLNVLTAIKRIMILFMHCPNPAAQTSVIGKKFYSPCTRRYSPCERTHHFRLSSSIQVWSRNFHRYDRICDCDLARIRCERRANRNRDDHSQRLRLC